MKISKLFIFSILINILLISEIFSQEVSNLPFKFKYQIKGEKIVKQIKLAYSKKNYKKIITLVKQIPPIFYLRPEENLIIAESYLQLGYPKEAINFAKKVISVKRGSFEACKAELIKIKALIIMEKTKNLKKELEDFSKSYCGKSFTQEAQALLCYLKALPLEETKKLNKNLLKKILGEIHRIKSFYLLNLGELEKAKNEIFYYINVYGNIKEAPQLLFKLAEGYFKKEKREQAKVLYKLIITQWDGTKEALLSKFRLYQIAYEKILAKELVPKKMIEDLIFYIAEIKLRYPKEKIAEEAQILEIKIYRDMKNHKMLRKAFKDFIKNYPESPFVKTASKFYCKAITTIFEKDYKRKKLKEILEIEKEDKEYLQKTKCGDPYYILGSLLLDYNFYNQGAYNFITAYELGVSNKDKSDLILKLSLTAFETGEYSLFKDLFGYLISKYKEKFLNSDPFYFYLRAIYEAQKNLNKADYYLKKALKSSLPEFYKEQLLRVLRDRAIALKNYQKAFDYVNNPIFKAKPEDYAFLLLETFYKNSDLFEEILKVSKEKFPKNTTIKWIEAYYLERKGEVRKADKIWEDLKEGSEYENELARSYEKLKELVEKSHQLVF
ncbi:tetratricopeptide repeat protein [Thermodesulfobacterium hydrogeniphilum]|uniref:tetratricopeptide repeat protein n=1 Tax=Thermodesulfobacterium hydrogeniphilum TaxID=161156 RepID=UPI00056EDF32|nr:hypothetical protein [Thermodesulfobacterium hydrogeniphilum]